MPRNAQTTTKKLILYQPHEMQRKLHESRARFRVASFGRQSGKSTWGWNELILKACNKANSRFWFVSPTYNQAQEQYRRMVGALWNVMDHIVVKNNQSELRVKLINQSEITFKSGEVFHNLRGSTLDGVILDEVRDLHPDLWPQVIRPMLTTTGGWAAFISTPRGFDQFYDIAQKAIEDTMGRWAYFSAPSTCNPKFTKEEFESLKSQMSEAEFGQEILAEFRDLTSGKAYVNFSEKNLSRINPFAMNGCINNPFLPVVLGCDFNLSPMCWTISQQNNGKWHFFDEVGLKRSHTPEAAEVLIEKLTKYKELGMLKTHPQIIVCGDATSKSGQRAAAGQSDYDILFAALSKAGFTFSNSVPESNPGIKDRVNAVNTKLKSAAGESLLTLDPVHCPLLKRDFDRVVWKEGTGAILDQTTDKTLTHMSDGAGYAIAALSPVTAVNSVGKLQVIIR